jgi:hypothetical protein
MTAQQENDVFRFLRQNRFAFLLAALVLLYFYGTVIHVIAPSLQSAAIRITLGCVMTYLILAGALTVAITDKSPKIVMLLAAPTILLEVLDVWRLEAWTQVLSHSFGMFFVAYIIVRLFKVIFTGDHVTADTIFAALCVYLLAGSFFAFAYSLLELFAPGAFFYSLEPELPRIMRLGGEPAGIEMYFSLVTMSTLGYGDIVPAKPAARSLAAIQAVMGQLYLAVLVARLVGIHVAESTRHKDR